MIVLTEALNTTESGMSNKARQTAMKMSLKIAGLRNEEGAEPILRGEWDKVVAKYWLYDIRPDDPQVPATTWDEFGHHLKGIAHLMHSAHVGGGFGTLSRAATWRLDVFGLRSAHEFLEEKISSFDPNEESAGEWMAPYAKETKFHGGHSHHHGYC